MKLEPLKVNQEDSILNEKEMKSQSLNAKDDKPKKPCDGKKDGDECVTSTGKNGKCERMASIGNYWNWSKPFPLVCVERRKVQI